MKQNMIAMAIGVAIAGMSLSAVAQVPAEQQEYQQQGQPQMQEQQQPQGQVMQQQDVDFGAIQSQAEAQVNSIDNEVGLGLSSQQVEELSQAMAVFMVGQHSATSDQEVQGLAQEYEEQINSILTEEQKNIIAQHAQHAQ